ncbi:hypothetical protein AB6A40_003597 [Gnathostoma spinigerum]|uniref:LRRCT domain-containing protein n=1 Tax=Gnathostoma spinigerum TaxID=75299 RepID=A0ABD6EIT9_9BILA
MYSLPKNRLTPHRHRAYLVHHHIIVSVLLLLINASSGFALVKKTYRLSQSESQFEVDCPRDCRCNKTTIACVNTDATSAAYFINVNPLAYPDLDTIVISGNTLHDLAGSNFFGANVTHRSVSLFNFTNNAITSFDAFTFQGLPALEYFYLSNNLIKNIGVDPFRGNLRLRVLDLSKLFHPQLPIGDRPKLISRLFKDSSNQFNDLQELVLRSNDIPYLEPDTFCNLPGLIRLHLGDNKLTTFVFNPTCLPNLHVLELAENAIKTLSVQLWDNLQSLETVDISSNPIECDCRMADFIKRLSQSSSAAFNQGRTKCASPSFLEGRNVFEVEYFNCNSNSRFILFFICLLLISCVVVLLWRYRSRVHIFSIPFFAKYSKLDDTERITAQQPQFV